MPKTCCVEIRTKLVSAKRHRDVLSLSCRVCKVRNYDALYSTVIRDLEVIDLLGLASVKEILWLLSQSSVTASNDHSINQDSIVSS